MNQSVVLRQTIVGVIAVLAALSTGPAAGKLFNEQKGICPDAMPAPGLMGTKAMRRYSDYETNPAHTKRQYERARLNFDRQNACATWIRPTAIFGVAAYNAYLHAPNAFQRKKSSIEEVKKNGVDKLPERTALQRLEKRYSETAIDLAYQGKGWKAIVKKLYCACQSDYPVAMKADQRAQERYNKTHSE